LVYVYVCFEFIRKLNECGVVLGWWRMLNVV
jgi:hypothetical protein